MTKEELIEKTDASITDLVYNKYELQKAYNYYLGKRDKKQFEYLEKNYGIGNPTSVNFTPLVKKHIDALVGEFLGVPVIPKISCKDSETISCMSRERELEVENRVFSFLKDHLRNTLLQFTGGNDTIDGSVKEQMDRIVEEVNESFTSKYEKAAQNVVKYVMQSRDTDMTTKLRQLLIDLLVTGIPLFRVTESPSRTNIEIEVLDPLNTFVERNPKSVYVKDSYRVVVRKWMTRDEILAEYGNELTKEDADRIIEGWDDTSEWGRYAMGSRDSYPAPEGILDTTYDPLPGHPDTRYTSARMRLVPVYEVEWLETDKDFMMYRYETVRLGEAVYILRGKDEKSVRSKDNPNRTYLRTNGVFYLNRANRPFSLMLSCMDIQDKYDLLIYYRDNLIASSGNIGDWIDLPLIPKALGDGFKERMEKWMAYKKAGLGIIDSSMEGRANTGASPMNTIFSGFDNTIKNDAIMAIQNAINSLEDTLSSITGVFRERLNGIEQRDAVTNIKQGVENSYIITKQYYQQMDVLTCEILTDCLNQAKKTWKNGVTGTIILGDGQQAVFTALPDEFTVTDYDITVVDTTDILQQMEQIWQVVPQLITSNLLPAEVLVDVMTSKSLTDIRDKVQMGMRKQKAENDQVQQLTKQLEETQQKLQQTGMQLQQTQAQLESLNKEKIEVEKQKIALEYKVDWYKAQTDRDYKRNKIDIDKKLAEIELEQTTDRNPYNNTVRRLGTFK